MAEKQLDFKSASDRVTNRMDLESLLDFISNYSSDLSPVIPVSERKKWDSTKIKNFKIDISQIDRVYEYEYDEYSEYYQLPSYFDEADSYLTARMIHKGEKLHLCIRVFSDYVVKYCLVYNPKVFVIACLGRTLLDGDIMLEELLKRDRYEVTFEELDFYLDYQWKWESETDPPSLQFMCKLAMLKEFPDGCSSEELGPVLAKDFYTFQDIRAIGEYINKDIEIDMTELDLSKVRQHPIFK